MFDMDMSDTGSFLGAVLGSILPVPACAVGSDFAEVVWYPILAG